MIRSPPEHDSYLHSMSCQDIISRVVVPDYGRRTDRGNSVQQTEVIKVSTFFPPHMTFPRSILNYSELFDGLKGCCILISDSR